MSSICSLLPGRYLIFIIFHFLANLELEPMGSGFQRIKGIETGRYVAMNSGGIVYSTVSKGVQLITDYVIRHIRSRFFEIKLSEIIKRP